MSSSRITALKPPKFDLSDDEGYQSIMEQTAASSAMDLDSGSSFNVPEKHSKFAVLNKACTLLQNPPTYLSLKPLATMADVDEQFMHILAWNVRMLDADTIARFDSEDQYKINAPHVIESDDYLLFLWDYIYAAHPPVPQKEELLEPGPIADAVITCLRQQLRRKSEAARTHTWDAIVAMKTDLSVLEGTLRQAEGVALLEPDKPQMAF